MGEAARSDVDLDRDRLRLVVGENQFVPVAADAFRARIEQVADAAVRIRFIAFVAEEDGEILAVAAGVGDPEIGVEADVVDDGRGRGAAADGRREIGDDQPPDLAAHRAVGNLEEEALEGRRRERREIGSFVDGTRRRRQAADRDELDQDAVDFRIDDEAARAFGVVAPPHVDAQPVLVLREQHRVVDQRIVRLDAEGGRQQVFLDVGQHRRNGVEHLAHRPALEIGQQLLADLLAQGIGEIGLFPFLHGAERLGDIGVVRRLRGRFGKVDDLKQALDELAVEHIARKALAQAGDIAGERLERLGVVRILQECLRNAFEIDDLAQHQLEGVAEGLDLVRAPLAGHQPLDGPGVEIIFDAVGEREGDRLERRLDGVDLADRSNVAAVAADAAAGEGPARDFVGAVARQRHAAEDRAESGFEIAVEDVVDNLQARPVERVVEGVRAKGALDLGDVGLQCRAAAEAGIEPPRSDALPGRLVERGLRIVALRRRTRLEFPRHVPALQVAVVTGATAVGDIFRDRRLRVVVVARDLAQQADFAMRGRHVDESIRRLAPDILVALVAHVIGIGVEVGGARIPADRADVERADADADLGDVQEAQAGVGDLVVFEEAGKPVEEHVDVGGGQRHAGLREGEPVLGVGYGLVIVVGEADARPVDHRGVPEVGVVEHRNAEEAQPLAELVQHAGPFAELDRVLESGNRLRRRDRRRQASGLVGQVALHEAVKRGGACRGVQHGDHAADQRAGIELHLRLRPHGGVDRGDVDVAELFLADDGQQALDDLGVHRGAAVLPDEVQRRLEQVAAELLVEPDHVGEERIGRRLGEAGIVDHRGVAPVRDQHDRARRRQIAARRHHHPVAVAARVLGVGARIVHQDDAVAAGGDRLAERIERGVVDVGADIGGDQAVGDHGDAGIGAVLGLGHRLDEERGRHAVDARMVVVRLEHDLDAPVIGLPGGQHRIRRQSDLEAAVVLLHHGEHFVARHDQRVDAVAVALDPVRAGQLVAVERAVDIAELAQRLALGVGRIAVEQPFARSRHGDGEHHFRDIGTVDQVEDEGRLRVGSACRVARHLDRARPCRNDEGAAHAVRRKVDEIARFHHAADEAAGEDRRLVGMARALRDRPKRDDVAAVDGFVEDPVGPAHVDFIVDRKAVVDVAELLALRTEVVHRRIVEPRGVGLRQHRLDGRGIVDQDLAEAAAGHHQIFAVGGKADIGAP